MKAAVYDQAGPPNVLEYRDVPEPSPGAGQVLIAVEAISLEGGDLINRRNATPPSASWIPGYAAAGTVLAVGPGVESRQPGDRVVAFDLQGSHAERWAVLETRTWLIPDTLDTASAAVIPIGFGTAYHSLFERARLRAGETLLIQAAAGGVGLAAVQLGAAKGVHVLAVASGAARCARIRELGAAHAIDREVHTVADEVLRITGQRGVDVVLDPVGTTLQASLSVLSTDGRLVFVGNAGGGGLTVDLWGAMQRNQSLLGIFMGAVLEKPEARAVVARLLASAARRGIRPIVDRWFPLSQAAAAHHYAETAKPVGRVILVPEPAHPASGGASRP